MKSTRLLQRLAVVVAALLIFGAAGIPSLSAADPPLSIGSSNITITSNGNYVITGTTTTNSITIVGGVTATITLKNVSITSVACPIKLNSGAVVTLLLDGTSWLTGTAGAGIHVPIGSSLFINEASPGGTLFAQGSDYCAGIGGNNGGSGTINIYGGTVTATGKYGGAGIGGGYGGNGGTVNIYGGTVTAIGGGAQGGAGIGDGVSSDGSLTGTISILGGSVTANGGSYSAGIGSAFGFETNAGKGGNVIISGGTVTATGGDNAAGIGSGVGSRCRTITIMGGNVSAIGGVGAAGIGGSNSYAGGTVVISGLNTRVTAKGGTSGHDIGSGNGLGPDEGGTLSVGAGVHLTLVTGMDSSIDPTKVTLGNCTVDGPGAGSYARTYKPPVSPITPATNTSDSVKAEAPVFLRSTNGSGVEIDISALALPAGVTLISSDFSGLPTQAAGKTWALSHKLAGTNGSFHGKDYLALYDFTLTDETGKPITGYIGRVTVRLPIPSGNTGTPHILYYDEADKQFTEVMAVPDNGYLTYSTTHLGSYLITSSSATNEKPAIPETGAPSFPFAAAGAVLILAAFYIARSRRKNQSNR